MEKEKMKEWVDQLGRLQEKRKEVEESGELGVPDADSTYTDRHIKSAYIAESSGANKMAYNLVGEDGRLDAEYVSELTGMELEDEKSAHTILTCEISRLLNQDDTEAIKSIVEDAYQVAR